MENPFKFGTRVEDEYFMTQSSRGVVIRRAFSVCCLILSIMLLGSCDPLSSYCFKIYNMTNDTVSIMMSPCYGYLIEKNGNRTGGYGDDNRDSIAILLPYENLNVTDDWIGESVSSLEEDGIIPLWVYIQYIKVGDRELPPEIWKQKDAWKCSKDGGGFGSGETMYYELWIREGQ